MAELKAGIRVVQPRDAADTDPDEGEAPPPG
jgi:hypothetical protein